MNESKIYELIVPEWSCVIPPDWRLKYRRTDGDWTPAASVVTLNAGDQLLGNGGPEEEYLAEMLAHSYVKELAAGE